MRRHSILLAFPLATLAMASPPAGAGNDLLIDLTHPTPTFMPDLVDPTLPDLSAPWDESIPIPTGGLSPQAVLTIGAIPTADWDGAVGRLTASEHTGTHIDAPNHVIPKPDTQEVPGDPSLAPRVNDLAAADLVGPVVLIDVSGRVAAELDRNGGMPHPDPATTDFSNDSPSAVGPDDVRAVAERLDDGVWLVLHFGWSRFFLEGSPDDVLHPYINGFNFPGMSPAGVDELVAVMEEKGISINGIVADNWSIDTGESTLGPNGDFSSGALPSHLRLFQRGVKLVENAANLGRLAQLRHPEKCTLFVGAPKHIRGTGGQARLIASCKGKDQSAVD